MCPGFLERDEELCRGEVQAVQSEHVMMVAVDQLHLAGLENYAVQCSLGLLDAEEGKGHVVYKTERVDAEEASAVAQLKQRISKNRETDAADSAKQRADGYVYKKYDKKPTDGVRAEPFVKIE